ncbi:MAG: tetratricopeptide repeat protein, partial [Alphaproteobacteria bacterium]|nr:tetratricopeptide repeat protein [Alphaproteobacteria bacterium]
PAAEAASSADATTAAATESCPDINAATPECSARREALDIWAKVEEANDRLTAKSAHVWASAAMSDARQGFEQAKQAFGAGRFIESRTQLRQVMKAMTDIEAEGERLFETSLADGAAALADEKAAEALAAYERAVLIHPDSVEATTGQARASALPKVLDVYNAGREAASAGRLDEAMASFRAARDLDPANEKVLAAITDLQLKVADRDFRAAMSRGLAAIEKGDGERAVQAFDQALAIRPTSAEARDGRARAATLAAQATVGSLIASAESAVSAGKWEEAAAAYDRALAIDATAETALSGKRRVVELIEIETELIALAAKPERLASAAVSQHARDILARASRMTPVQSRLQTGIEGLQSALAAMQKSVEVRLVSDGRTTISIQRLGQVGTLQERVIAMTPGRYVITGTRKGFRDIRLEVEIRPDSAVSTVSVICNEPI